MDTYSKINLSVATHRQISHDEFDWKQCKRIKQILIQTFSGNDSDQNEKAPNSSDQYHFQDIYDLRRRHLFHECNDDLGVVMNAFIGEFKKISTDSENSLYTAHGMDEDGYWNALIKDVDSLKAISLWLKDQVVSYAANKTTKIGLSNSIGQHTLSSLKLSLDSLIYAITIKGIEPLLTKANTLSTFIPNWYKRTLSILQTSIPSYGDRGVKSLHIWRHPVALLETEEILKFKFSVFDAWRSWEMSATLDNFIVSGNAGSMISNATKDFTNTLHRELLRLKMRSKHVRNEVMQSLETVISDLADIQREKSTDEKFVL